MWWGAPVSVLTRLAPLATSRDSGGAPRRRRRGLGGAGSEVPTGPSERPGRARASAGAPAAATRVLVVEDELILALDLQATLRRLGYEVPPLVHRGEDVAKAVRESRPDLVLMDINLRGGTNGIEAAGQLRGELDVPVVYLTAYSESETVRQAEATDPYGYLIKPYEERQLAITMQMALRRRALEREVTDQQRRLAQAERLKTIGTLAGGVAHDFNNLLTVVTGFTDLALGALRPDQAEVRAWLEHVLQASRRGASLTHQLLAFSREQPLAPVRTVASDLLAEIRQLVGTLVGGEIELELILPPVRPVRVDPGELQNAVFNLAANARAAMPSGGKLTIEVADGVELVPEAEEMDRPPNDYVMLSVRDTGVGMDRETLARAFEPFYTTRRGRGGTGLGLSSVQGFVSQSGGWIEARSEPGAGTCFRMFFPAADEGAVAPPADDEAPAGPPPERGSARVLLVEDEDPVRELLELYLVEAGYVVLGARDGQEALELAEEAGEVDLVVTDVQLPLLSGVDLVEALQERAGGPIRALLMTGYTPDGLSPKVAESFGRSNLLLKPVLRERFLEAVGEALAAG